MLTYAHKDVQSNYRTAMHIVDPGKTAKTAAIFATYPVCSSQESCGSLAQCSAVLPVQAEFITFANAWFSEFVGTALLCAFVMAVTDNSK
jgi:glycerol uptake facilitator-like aquaporin